MVDDLPPHFGVVVAVAVGVIAAVVFLVTLVMVRAFFESWRGD